MKYQLVLQFSAVGTTAFEELVDLEDSLIDELPRPAIVDGHDFGSCELNIFILTDEPVPSFEVAKGIVQRRLCGREFRAAYRETQKEDFIGLWPPNLRSFAIS